MAWGELFLASRQIIFGDKEPGTDELANKPGFHATRFASAKFDQRKGNAHSTDCGAAGSGGGREENGSNQSLLPKAARQPGRWNMPLYMYQAAYTAESLSRPAQEAGEPS
jgi:hypothetical protein